MEAVKKLQNSTKLLQKVIDYSMEGGEGGLCLEQAPGTDSAPAPNQMCRLSEPG